MGNLLAIKNLGLQLEDTEILKKVSLEIKKGEIKAIIGPNGCGKSSLAYSVMGLKGYEPQEGRIIFKGADITERQIDERARAGITVAFQEPSRFEGVSVREYLSLGLKSRGLEVKEERLVRALREVAITPKKYLGRNIDETLSGGERKRIELASILVMEPELVILDEPDSGVDVVALNSIGGVISDLRERDAGVMLITHSDKMLAYADSAILICQGKIIQRGEPQEISRYFRYECGSCEEEDYRKHTRSEVKDIG
ncbi:MAG: ABC transporter ATP-binding protein [Halanaerobiaceae bacterium]